MNREVRNGGRVVILTRVISSPDAAIPLNRRLSYPRRSEANPYSQDPQWGLDRIFLPRSDDPRLITAWFVALCFGGPITPIHRRNSRFSTRSEQRFDLTAAIVAETQLDPKSRATYSSLDGT